MINQSELLSGQAVGEMDRGEKMCEIVEEL